LFRVFLSVNEYMDKDSLDDTGGVSPASCFTPCLLQGPGVAAIQSPSWMNQLTPLLRKPGYEHEDFTTSRQLFHLADRVDTGCTRYHYSQHDQSGPLSQQNTVWPGTPITPSTLLKQLSQHFHH